MANNVGEEIKRVRMGYTDAGMELMTAQDPAFLEGVKAFYSNAVLDRVEGSVFDRKTKELIIMVCNAVMRCELGIHLHARRALMAGAKPREVLEALEVAAIPGGMPTVWIGARILAEELEALGRSFE